MYLSKAINNGFGCSYSQLINCYRINYLIEEAQRTGENIALLAARCRFWSRSTFFDVFRQHTGMTPHRYMENVRRSSFPKHMHDHEGQRIVIEEG